MTSALFSFSFFACYHLLQSNKMSFQGCRFFFKSLKMCLYCLLLQMSHTKPYIRKKAVLIMYKVFLKYPESLRPAFPRLKEKLEDPDPGIRKHSIYPVC